MEQRARQNRLEAIRSADRFGCRQIRCILSRACAKLRLARLGEEWRTIRNSRLCKTSGGNPDCGCKERCFLQYENGKYQFRICAGYYAKAGTSPVVNAKNTSNADPQIAGEAQTNVTYRTHVQSYGWQAWKYNGQMSGTSGQAKRLEGINIRLSNQQYSGDIVYTTHVQSYGWQGNENNQSTWRKNGVMSGTSGEAKRLEAIRINLTGEMAKHYDIYYRVHAQSFGWLDWAKNGAPSGTAGYAKRLEGIQIILVPKGQPAPAKNYGGITSVRASYIAK